MHWLCGLLSRDVLFSKDIGLLFTRAESVSEQDTNSVLIHSKPAGWIKSSAVR